MLFQARDSRPFPSQSPGGLQGTEGGASSRLCCLLELELLSQKLKTCALPPFLMLLLTFQRIPCHFLESSYPQLIRQKERLVNFSRVDSSSPEDLVVLAELPSPAAGASPRTKHFLPVSFLLLQRMLVGRPDLGLSFQKGRAPGETREPLGCTQ